MYWHGRKHEFVLCKCMLCYYYYININKVSLCSTLRGQHVITNNKSCKWDFLQAFLCLGNHVVKPKWCVQKWSVSTYFRQNFQSQAGWWRWSHGWTWRWWRSHSGRQTHTGSRCRSPSLGFLSLSAKEGDILVRYGE